ncbi:MAG: YggT family protein [Candidatus Saccharimonadales bacterium]
MDEKQTQVTEVRETNQQAGDTKVRRQAVETRSSLSGSIIAQRVVWYIVGVIVALLAVRIVLQLLGANQGNGFVDFVYSLSGIFAAPFFGMFSYQPTYGASTLEIGTIVGIIVYTLVGWGFAKLFTIGSQHHTTV